MKLRRKALWPVLIAMAVVLGWFLFYPGNDLTYQGQRLSVWFDQMFRARTQEEREQARDAFKAMGEHAIPFLVDRLKAQDPPWREKYRQFYFTHSSRWPRWIAARFPVPSAENAEFVRANAAWLLGSLGEKAKPAVPALARALADESPSVRSSAAQ